MIEFLLVMALSIVGVALCVLGVGMASRRKSKSSARVDARYVSGFGKGLETVSKGVRVAGALYAGVNRVSKALDKDFLSKEQLAELFAGEIESQAAAEDTSVAASMLMEPLIGRDRADGVAALYQYLKTGDVPSAYYGREDIGNSSRSLTSGGTSLHGNMTYDEERLMDVGYKHAVELGLNPANIDIYFSKSLSNKTDRERLEKIGDKYHIGISKKISYIEQVEAIKHAEEHIKDMDASEAEIHRRTFERRLHDYKKTGDQKKKYEIIAQLSYIDELGKNPGTYYDEATGTTQRYTEITKKFKELSPAGKELLENKDFQKQFDLYRSHKKFSGLT